jgi:hypothetical protein
VKGRQKKKKKDDNPLPPPPPPTKPVNPPPLKSTPVMQPILQKKQVPPPAPVIVKDMKPISSTIKDGEKPKYSQVTSQSVSAVAKKPVVTPTAPLSPRTSNSTSTIDSKLQSSRINTIPESTNSDLLNGISSLRVTSDRIETNNNDLSYLNAFFPQNTLSQSIPGLIDNFLGAPISNDAKISRTSTPPLSTMAPPGLGLGLGATSAPPGLGLGIGTSNVNFCPSCGSKLQQSHRFCYNCGSDIKTSVSEVAPDTLSSANRLSGILGDSNNLYMQPTQTASTISSSPFLDTWNLPIPTSQPISIPGLPTSSSQGNFSMKEDLSFNVFGTKDSGDSDILAINSMLTSDAPPFIPASMKTQPPKGLSIPSKSTSSSWEDPSLSSSFGNVNMLMSFLGDDDSSKAPAADQKSQQAKKDTSRLGIFNKGGYI